jgi:hypothetical protein
MGLSKTVTFKMAESLIDPLNTLVEKIKDFSDGKPRPAVASTGRPRNLIDFLTRPRKPPAPLQHSADVLKSQQNSVVESLTK